MKDVIRYSLYLMMAELLYQIIKQKRMEEIIGIGDDGLPSKEV